MVLCLSGADLIFLWYFELKLFYDNAVMVVLLATHSTAGVILTSFCTEWIIIWTNAYSFAQTKLNVYWKNCPAIVRIQNVLEFCDMANDQNDNSLHLKTNSSLENTLVLYIAK